MLLKNGKILVVTNRYPPDTVGGYELRCKAVVEELIHRGYSVQVVTAATDGVSERTARDESYVHRRLPTAPDPFALKRSWEKIGFLKTCKQAREQFLNSLDAIKPDIVFWWNMDGLPLSILDIPEIYRLEHYYWLEDQWPKALRMRNGKPQHLWFRFRRGEIASGLSRFFMGKCDLTAGMIVADKAYSVSEYIQEKARLQELPAQEYRVIHGGVDPAAYLKQEPVYRQSCSDPLRLLYIGAITPDRGLQEIVEAMAAMPQPEQSLMRLTVSGRVPANWAQPYLEMIHDLIASAGLQHQAQFLNWVSPDECAALYAQHHILVHSSQRGEGWPLVITEAMFCGLDIIASGAGGAAELAAAAGIDTYSWNNPVMLARILSHRLKAPAVSQQNGERLRAFARQHYTLETLCDRLLESMSAAKSAVIESV